MGYNLNVHVSNLLLLGTHMYMLGTSQHSRLVNVTKIMLIITYHQPHPSTKMWQKCMVTVQICDTPETKLLYRYCLPLDIQHEME